eukprot:gb/GECH01008605.1/.p1 GENE.gb/GECH01008605.1/~~gb/GECH01008605.1/.p1  ORF type:complete len:467 (+),score=89.74 gb/GECH01008605.1/:1-1401(+)
MLDIALFREDKGGNPKLIRESQRRRFADESLVDEVLKLDAEWRSMRGQVDNLKRTKNACSKIIGKRKKAKQPDGEDGPIDDSLISRLSNLKIDDLNDLNVTQLRRMSGIVDKEQSNVPTELKRLEEQRSQALLKIGNLVHEDVPVSNDEDHNKVLRTHGETATAKFNHVSLMEAIQGIDTHRGAETAGSRGFYMQGPLFLLHFALCNYALQFLTGKGYQPIYPPYFMRQGMMQRVAQLEQFDEELYQVSGDGTEPKYLIATSEQPIAAFHVNQRMHHASLPIRYAGFSTCFRKEAGSHGRDTLGIFRIHQFEKVEQFCVTSPHDDASWDMMEDMMQNAEAFYQSLGIPYRIVSIVSGKLNNAAAMKQDLEAWFPASQTYRELVSCSNCTDYQSRRLDVRYGQTTKKGGEVDHVHMLNSTLCAVQRALCCVVENNQTEDGIRVPEVLVPFMGGTDFIPFRSEPKAQG